MIGAAWLVSVGWQSQLPLSPIWAALDGVRHGAAAGVCTVWLRPRWGWTPVVVACLAGVLLDLDHALAARSVDPVAMMGLGVRPITHSLLFGALLGTLVWPVLGRACGYALGAGITLHLFEDSLSWPGTPLLFPVWSEQHVLVPVLLAVLTTLGLSGLSLWLGRPPLRPRQRR